MFLRVPGETARWLAATGAKLGTDAVRIGSEFGASVTRAATGLGSEVAGDVTQATAKAAAFTGLPLDAPARAAVTVARTVARLLDPREQHEGRRVWVGGGCCHIQLRSPSADADPGFADELRRQLRRLEGVRWSDVNEVMGRVLVAYDDRRLTVPEIVDVVSAVERARGRDEQPFDRHRPEHPGDFEPLVAAGVALGGDLLGVVFGVTGRAVRLPRLPRSTHAFLALTEGQPAVRDQIEHRLGPLGTDLLFALLRAGLHSATQRPVTLLVDVLYRTQRFDEVWASRAVWLRRQGALHRAAADDVSGLPLAVEAPGARPRPLPNGPIERYANQVAAGSLAVAGAVLTLTRSPARAADVLVTGVPKAARLGRESFAATCCRRMAHRGVVTLDNGVWRRLDRVDTILVDAAVLRAAPQEGGEELNPEGAVVLDTARGSGARLLVTELGPHAPIAPPDEVVPATRTLVDTVRELQADGRAVLVVSAADGPALEAADVGIGVLTANTAPAWGADLLCGPGLGDAVRLVGSVRVAKRVSERSVRLDLVATALGWLLAVAPPPPRGFLRSAGAPMGVAVLAAMGLAWWDARSVDRLADSDATARAALRAGS